MILLVVVVLIIAIFAPQLWARHVLKAHSRERHDLPGSGAELARHLLSNAHMDNYRVEAGESGAGDHFDPDTCTIVLSPAHCETRSLAAAVVAAHEVGHAIQHYIGYQPLRWRTRLARSAGRAERLASVILVAMPFATVLSRAPGVGAGFLVVGLGVMLLPVVIHLVTLPVEFDASFRRAMPILESGYLEQKDLPHARRILTACALTYFAVSLASLLNFWRWIRILRA